MSTTLTNINLGALPNDGTGDPLRVAFDKINTNLLALSGLTPGAPDGAIQFNQANVFSGSANLVYDYANNQINVGANIVPSTGSIVSLGANTSQIANLFLTGSALHLGNISVVESGNIISFPITKDSSNMASAQLDNLSLDGNLTVAGTINFGNIKIGTTSLTTIDTTVNQVIYQIPAAGISQSSFQITSRDGSNNSQTATIMVNKNSNNLSASYSIFGTVFIGTPLTQYNVAVAYGNVLVMVSPIVNTVINHVLSYQENT